MSITKQEINILLLGETGVGKTLFINAFVNYLNYDKLENAINGDIICQIPTQFIITDADFKKKTINYGNDSNEMYENKGQSVTQQCRAYCFDYNNNLLRIIDTPGIGDTRGIEQDKLNLEHLLSFIGEYEKLHLICILLKPNMERMTPSFKYCLKQMLIHLQKDASNNIVFVFTNTRPTFYRPQNTLVLLEEILDEIQRVPPNVIIPLDKSTMYCLDNCSFQFLIALRNNITFSDEERVDFSGSWSKSVDECMRLINYIKSGKNGQPLTPHLIQDTLSINEISKLLFSLQIPLAMVTEHMINNLKLLDKVRIEISKFEGDIDVFTSNIRSNVDKFSFWDLVPDMLFGANSAIFGTNSNLFGPNTPIYGKALLNLMTVIKSYLKENNDKNNKLLLKNMITNKEKKTELLKEIENTLFEWNKEKQELVSASAKFAYFIKYNSIATYNDWYKSYLIEQIADEKQSNKDENEIKDRVEMLETILNEYEREKCSLEKSPGKGKETETNMSLHISALIQQLYKLKHSGSEIKRLHEESKSKQTLAIRTEVYLKLKPKSHKLNEIFAELFK